MIYSIHINLNLVFMIVFHISEDGSEIKFYTQCINIAVLKNTG